MIELIVISSVIFWIIMTTISYHVTTKMVGWYAKDARYNPEPIGTFLLNLGFWPLMLPGMLVAFVINDDLRLTHAIKKQNRKMLHEEQMKEIARKRMAALEKESSRSGE